MVKAEPEGAGERRRSSERRDPPGVKERARSGVEIEEAVVIAASPESVWSALTEAPELARWLPIDARVTPGVGGSVWMSWE